MYKQLMFVHLEVRRVPLITLVLFDKLEVTIDIGLIILAIVTMVIYDGYMNYVKSAYGITDKVHNKIINEFPNYIEALLIVMTLFLSMTCKWI